jgi:16S rRNA pseudouridine516 synthase
MTLAQLLFSQGFGTRKMCSLLIADGAVTINGQVCDEGDKTIDVSAPDFTFQIEGAAPPIWPYREKAYLMLHKPIGYECSQKAKSYPTVYRLLADPLRTRGSGGVQAVGRLDQDTTGLLLFSDDGQFIHRMASPKHHVPKIYDVTLSEPATDAQIQKLLAGVVLDDDPAPVHALACTHRHAPNEIQMTLAQGKYHQVKRMMAAVGNHVEKLHRSQIGQLKLPDDLPLGEWRWLSVEDLALVRGK